jgi:transposase-like protein
MAPRRTAKEWGRLIRELERSGQTVAAFALARGIRPDTLKWWRWRLGRDGRAEPREAATKKTPPTRVQLVAVEPAREASRRTAADERSTATPVWELKSPSGHMLRVYDRGGLGVLRAALSAVAGKRRR